MRFLIVYLKVVVAQRAVVFTFRQTTFFEICDLNRTDINRFDRVFRAVLYHRERFSSRV
jgi:hypothetical protein